MAIRWIDVTMPLNDRMTVWPGHPPFSLQPHGRIAEGAGSNTSLLSFDTHMGTHVDAPWHFEPGGKRLDEVDTSLFFGDALLIEVAGPEHVTADRLGPDPLPPRVLVKTVNSALPMEGPFREDFTALAPDAAQRLVDEGVRLVGVDYLSVAPYKQPGQHTHHILLSNEVFVVEGLRLAECPPGTHAFTVLPLPLTGADGAPCRAFVGVG